MLQLVRGGWTLEQSDVLKDLILNQKHTCATAAVAINERFGTAFTRNAIIGRCHRIGLQSPVRPKSEFKAPRKRAVKNHESITRIVRSNGNSNSMRVLRSVETAEYKMRCVEIEPRNVSLIDLEPSDCRYPYGDDTIAFCGHPRQKDSSYCTPHHHLCWVPPKLNAPKARIYYGTDFAQGAA